MSTVIYAALGYLFLLLTVRVLTRRPGAQLTLFEFVIVFLVGGVIILATVGNDRSITNCSMAIITVTSMHRIIGWLKSHSRFLDELLDGIPLVIFQNGKWQTNTMKKMRINEEDVMAVGRTKGVRSIREIRYAILERNGAISIIKHSHE
jgi:uncharacterized membrane protein YcaP (DUF421 family)